MKTNQINSKNYIITLLFKNFSAKVSTLLLIIIPVFLFSSCNNANEGNTEKVESISQEETAHQHGDDETLRLNNGKKWVVVKEMLVYIDYMKSDINKFEGTTVEDYKNLATDLLINVDLLTANCTMKGDAHDQLHLWLLPFIDYVNEFAAAENIEDSKTALHEVKTSFELYEQYFE